MLIDFRWNFVTLLIDSISINLVLESIQYNLLTHWNRPERRKSLEFSSAVELAFWKFVEEGICTSEESRHTRLWRVALLNFLRRRKIRVGCLANGRRNFVPRASSFAKTSSHRQTGCESVMNTLGAALGFGEEMRFSKFSLSLLSTESNRRTRVSAIKLAANDNNDALHYSRCDCSIWTVFGKVLFTQAFPYLGIKKVYFVTAVNTGRGEARYYEHEYTHVSLVDSRRLIYLSKWRVRRERERERS